METAALVASTVSIVLAVVAIVLSAFFYRMTKDSSEKAREASKDISSGVEKLEKLFDRMYADTFGMMRDTVSDMRQHMWPEAKNISRDDGAVEIEVEKKLTKFKDEIISELMDKFGNIEEKTDAKMDGLRLEFDSVVSRIIDDTRGIEKEVLATSLRQDILYAIKKSEKRNGFSSAMDIIEIFDDFLEYQFTEILSELFSMYQDGKLLTNKELRGRDDIKPNTLFSIAPQGQVDILKE